MQDDARNAMLDNAASTTTPDTSTLQLFRAVSFADRDTAILHDITLTLTSGPPTVLMGPNGSGKTTLLKLAGGLIIPTGGDIATASGLQKSFVFQRPVMLRRTAAANVAFARAAAGFPTDDATIAALLDRVGLAHLADRPARKLSGGEQQRLALARALAREPDILYLDEPTASLDPAASKSVEDIIRSIAASGVKVVMASHDIGQARRIAGDVVLLVNGAIAEHASAAQFFTAPSTNRARRFLAGELVI